MRLIYILFLLPCLITKSYSQDLFSNKNVLGYSTLALSGIVHGAREAYHAEPSIFNTKSPTSFFGPEAWKRAYFCKDPTQPHRSELLGNITYDFWHSSNAVHKVTIISGSFILGTKFFKSKKPFYVKIIPLVIGTATQTLFSNLTYTILRK